MRGASEFVEWVAVGDVRRRETVFVGQRKRKDTDNDVGDDIPVPVQRRQPAVALHLRVHLRCRRANRHPARGHVENFSHVIDEQKLNLARCERHSRARLFRALQRILASRHEAGARDGVADAHSRTIETIVRVGLFLDSYYYYYY